jgi:hypothetical protein
MKRRTPMPKFRVTLMRRQWATKDITARTYAHALDVADSLDDIDVSWGEDSGIADIVNVEDITPEQDGDDFDNE